MGTCQVQRNWECVLVRDESSSLLEDVIPADPTKTSNEKFNPYFALENLVALDGGCDVRSPEHGGGVASVLHGGDEEVLLG